MRKKRFPAAVVALMAVGLAIAGATARPAPSADLSPTVSTDLSSALETLIDTGVWPADVTAEPGVWNYAGPNCPGPGWNCTALSPFSFTLSGTVSVVECVGATCPPITQGGDVNVAKCEQKVQTTAALVEQQCEITQTGKDNQATVVQVIDQTGGPTQGAVQEALISQTATASKNQLQVDQEIKQYTEIGTTQDQDAYQVVRGPGNLATLPAEQIAAGAGDSQAQINQKQNQRAKGGEIQTQNDGVTTFTPPADCHLSFVSPANPNLCSTLDQTSGSGHNQSQLTQTWDVEATTNAPLAVQQQGPAKFTGGADGRVHQVTTSPGFSQGQATQSETLKLFAPPGSNPDQEQYGGAGCCGFGSQIGPGTEWLDQKKDLEAVGGTFQSATLVGTLSSPDGSCGIDHDVQTNSDQATESASSEPCIALAVITTCENSGGNGDEEVGACADSTVEACEPGETPFVDDDDEDGIPDVMCNEDDGPPILT